MPYIAMLIMGALIFGGCFLVDKGFHRIFRNQKEHKSGLAVRVNKRYAAFGAIFMALGVASILSGTTVMIVAGIIVLLIGLGLVVYYETFGIYYDTDSFIYASFGKKNRTYRYREILTQQLYNVSGNTVIELHMKDGKSISLQAWMPGVYEFMDTAFAGWCRQNCRKESDCPFHDPDNSCWFPPMEEE